MCDLRTLVLLCSFLLRSGAVKAPSASASTSLQTSLLALNAAGDEVGGVPGLGGRGNSVKGLEPVREECKVKNLKQQQRMLLAKLDAHRCLVRDTVVELPMPNDVIVNFMQPSHVVVPRCTGLCLERPGCDCQPKKTRLTKIDVIIGTNSSTTHQLCTTVDVEEHRGPCRCKCTIANCHYNKVFDEGACLCRCKAEFAALKSSCATDFEREWHEDTCTCKCKPRICVSGHYQDRNSCNCRPVEPACTLGSSATTLNKHLNASPAIINGSAAAQTPKYIGLACVVAVALAMLLSLYYMMAKRRTDSIPIVAANGASGETVVGTLQRATTSNGRQTAAYTITINSASATNLDEAVLPLTEDKTRF